MDYSDLKRYDPSGMHEVYNKWPQFAREAYEADLEPVDFKNIDHIVFAGMGGSGAIGDLFSAILSKSNIHVSLVKGYVLPKTVDEKTLVVIISVSGNTVESQTVLEYASKINCNVVAFSSGGMMESFCKKNSIPFRKIPKIHSPRSSFPTYVYSVIKVLNSILPINKKDVLESIFEFEKLKNKIATHNLTDSNPSLKLAELMSGIPLIYFPVGLQAAAIRFKNSLQENTKIHVIVEDVIEACHNGIVSWEKTSDVQPILLQGVDDYIKTKERWNILKDYFKSHNIAYLEIHSINGNILSKLICLVYLLDFVSIYHAVKTKTDPTPVNSIDYIKERL
jgi:glucose/mannose-6-phosphate isomerase